MTAAERINCLHRLNRAARNIHGQLEIIERHPEIDQAGSLACLCESFDAACNCTALLISDYSTPEIAVIWDIAQYSFHAFLRYAKHAAPSKAMLDLAFRTNDLFIALFYAFQNHAP
jgi:hypothetical protein